MKIKFMTLAAALLAAVSALAQDWAPAGDRIRTRWAAEVSPGNVLPEYPRPQMVRPEWQSLNGLWDYSIKPVFGGPMDESDGSILVPFAVESSLSGVGRTVGADSVLWYRRSFTVPREWKRRRVLLHFGAVDWLCSVYVNGRWVGRHQGGYSPFSFDITGFLKGSGPQELMVEVYDATDNDLQPRGKQVSSPGSIWYTPVTGIWQTVWLEPVSGEAYIADYKVVSDIDASTLTVTPAVSGAVAGDRVLVELLDGCEGYSAESPSEKVLAFSSAPAGEKVELKVPDARLWSCDSPYLYGIRISLLRDCSELDAVQAYTALRSISVVTDSLGFRRMALNGRPLFQFGPLDQGFWPDGLYTAPTDEALRFDIEKARDLGFNMIRKHIKVEPARWYRWCDVCGMLVWQDMPSVSDNSRNKWASSGYDAGTDTPLCPQAKENYMREWPEIMSCLDKFQCIVVWVPFNEAWGQFDTRRIASLTHSLDSTRLVNAASGGNFVPGAGDIIDAHNYPEPWPNFWDRDKVNVLGEYGGLGYAVPGHLWRPDRNWGYVQYRSVDEVTDKYLEFLGHLVWQVREKGTCAAVYTQITDVEIEVNGLLTYDRAVVKVREEDVRNANIEMIVNN